MARWLLSPWLASSASYPSSVVSMCSAEETCGAEGRNVPGHVVPHALSWHSQPFMCLQQGMCQTCGRQLW